MRMEYNNYVYFFLRVVKGIRFLTRQITQHNKQTNDVNLFSDSTSSFKFCIELNYIDLYSFLQFQ